MRFFLTCAFVLLMAASGLARIINVPADYATIQAGIDASVNGDTVLVGPGTYIESLNMHGRNILLTSSNGPDTTFVHGGCSFIQGEDSTCILRGFCFLPPTPPNPWALIGCLNGSSPKIEGNIIMSNQNSSLGGAIYARDSDLIIRSNIIKNNYAQAAGGGMYIGDVWHPALHAEISRNIIANNRTGYTMEGLGTGGGLIVKGYAAVRENLIYDNSAVETMQGGDGGGIYRNDLPGISGYCMIIENNTVVNNAAKTGGTHGRGGGLFFISNNSSDSLIIRNNIFAFNTWGGEVRGNPYDSMSFYWDYNLIYGDTSLGFSHGEHDIFLDPHFVDTLNNNYHLLPNSPCVDAGDPLSPLDPDSTRADIGAYYFDQSVDITDPSEPIEPFDFRLSQNYPNPFNSETVILYTLDNPGIVNLAIYSISGQLIRRLINNIMQSQGEHKAVWDAKDNSGKQISTGIYIYRLSVDSISLSRAMITIK